MKNMVSQVHKAKTIGVEIQVQGIYKPDLLVCNVCESSKLCLSNASETIVVCLCCHSWLRVCVRCSACSKTIVEKV